MAGNQNQNQSDVVQHGINAAQANAANQEEQQQVEELSSQLNEATTNATAQANNADSESNAT
jgi:hypothetical protein